MESYESHGRRWCARFAEPAPEPSWPIRRTLKRGRRLHRHRPALGQARAPGAQARSRRATGSASAARTWASRSRPPSATSPASITPPRSAATASPSDTVEHLLSALYALGVDDVLRGGGRARDPGHGRQRGALRDPDPRGRAAAPARSPALPEGAAARSRWSAAASGRACSPSDHFRVSYTIGFDHPLLRHQAASVPRHRRLLRGGDRPRAHLRLPARGGDAAQERAWPWAAAWRTRW